MHAKWWAMCAKMTRVRLLLVAFLLTSCIGGIPENFDTLPLEKQIETYGHHWKTAGTPLLHARAAIAKHGYAAADRMCDEIEKEGSDYPLHETLEIISDVQSHGCSLRGTRAHVAIQTVLSRRDLDEYEVQVARTALMAIETNFSEPTAVARRGKRPC